MSKNIGTQIPVTNTAGIYARADTRKGINKQVEFLRDFCRRNGLEVVEVYADQEVLGITPMWARSGGSRLKAAAKEGKFTKLVVMQGDRIGRSLAEAAAHIEELKALGVSVVLAMSENKREGRSHRAGEKVRATRRAGNIESNILAVLFGSPE